MKDAIKIAANKAKAKRDAWVLSQYANKKRSPTDIAKELGVSRQRVHQIIKEAGESK